jgi:integrase
MAARRGKGSGGVRPYKRQGKVVGWRAEASRVLPDGRPYYRSKTFPAKRGLAKADAERWLRDELARLDAGTPEPTGTLGAWLDQWFAGHKGTAAATNWRRDGQMLDRHIRPRLAALRLDAVTAARVNAWLGDLAEAGVSDSERRRAGATLKKALRAHERVPRALWDRVRLPTVRRAESRHLAPAELAALLAAADSWEGWYGAMVRAAVDCGLRAGEVLGLKGGDYDPAAGRLSVRRAVCVQTGKLKDTKTEKSRRTLPVSPPTRAALDALPRGDADAPLFPAPRSGGHYRYLNWVHTVWWPLTKAAGLKGVPPKALRHTGASLLIAAGANVVVVSRRLGHSTVTQTLNTYAHLFPDDQDKAAAMLTGPLQGP